MVDVRVLMQMPVEGIEDIIKTIECGDSKVHFLPWRYPYVYAYDFILEHWQDFGIPLGMSRYDIQDLFRDHPDRERVCIALADAYLREWRIAKTEQVRIV